VAVIVGAVLTLGFVVWPGGPAVDVRETSDSGWWVAAQFAGGSLAVASVFIALKYERVAKVLAAIAGVLVLSALLSFSSFGTVAVIAVIVPGVLMLGAAPFMGRMPMPEDEGKSR
jgi:fatty acid desaturase